MVLARGNIFQQFQFFMKMSCCVLIFGYIFKLSYVASADEEQVFGFFLFSKCFSKNPFLFELVVLVLSFLR